MNETGMNQQNLMLRGLVAPVRLSGEGWNAGDFSEFLPNWPFEIVDVTDATPFATRERTDHGFVFSSDFGDGPAPHASLVNMVCDLIAHAARQRTRERPDDLCLHASAVQVGEGLVVMPATRRAGKSVMTAVFGRARTWGFQRRCVADQRALWSSDRWACNRCFDPLAPAATRAIATRCTRSYRGARRVAEPPVSLCPVASYCRPRCVCAALRLCQH